MEASKAIDLKVINKEAIIRKIHETMRSHKNILISGEEGVGKITHTLEALRDSDGVFYIGNPVDYVGKPRPKGYDKYINYITSLKSDMHIMAGEKEILAFAPSALQEGSNLVIDEIYGRSEAQYRKILEILKVKRIQVFLITGCLKNAGKIIHSIDTVLMFTKDGALQFDKEFAVQLCTILKAETL